MVVYLDDIVVYSGTLEEHLRAVFQILSENLFYVKKDTFAQQSVFFLGHRIKGGTICMEGEGHRGMGSPIKGI